MKIIMSSTGPSLDSALDPRFGRCAYFVILDSGTGALEAVPNPFLDAAGGAGTQAAQWVLDQEADLLLTGRCGPKAAAVLGDASIRVVEAVSGSLREASAPYLAAAGAGTRGAAGCEPGGSDGRRRGRGLGSGRGRGACRQGAGRGQGTGRGAGRGAGRGHGRPDRG